MRGVLRFRNGRAYGYAFTRRTCAHNGSAHYAREGATTRIPGGYKVRGAPRSPIGVRTNIIDVDASTYAPDGSIVRARYVRGAIANTLRVTPNAADRFIARYNAERTYGQA
jgi:hypothetical protein